MCIRKFKKYLIQILNTSVNSCVCLCVVCVVWFVFYSLDHSNSQYHYDLRVSFWISEFILKRRKDLFKWFNIYNNMFIV